MVELENLNTLIERAKCFISKYSISEIEALKMAENDVEKQIKNRDFENGRR